MLHLLRAGTIGVVSLLAMLGSPLATAGMTQSADDPWPRSIDLGGGTTATLYQPQVESWVGNRLSFRSAVVVSEPRRTGEDSGAVWATAVTRVDRVSRLVVLDELNFARAALPSLSERGTAYLNALQAQLQAVPQTIALDRLQASLGAAHTFKHAGLAVQNTPPRILVSDAPARMVTIAGAPVLQPVAGTSFERVINTRALILRDARSYYLLVGDGWMTAETLDGRWYPAERVPPALDRIAVTLGPRVDPLVSGVARAAHDGMPKVFVTQTPAALVVFDGEPVLEPIAGTTLLRAANTTSNVIVDIVSGHHYLLLSGRWFRAPGLNGPWTYVSSRALPRDFAAIPADEPAAVVLASVAGTQQAQQALIDDATPQTATVPRVNGASFTAEFDGHPQYRPIAGTALSYVANSPTPIIRVEGRRYFALKAGVWFEAPSVFGAWAVAASVPDVIYTVPTSSPLHHVTYVRVYSASSQVVEVGYTQGYVGSVVTPEGVVVHGSGYVYPSWIGNTYFPAPMTYGAAARWRDDLAPNIYAQWGGAVYTGLRGYRYLASSAPRATLIESYAAAVADNDHYADVNGTVWRSRGGSCEKQGGRGWEHAAPEQCAWASSEREARASGAQRFERHRARDGVDGFAEGRPAADAMSAGNSQVGALRGRSTAP